MVLSKMSGAHGYYLRVSAAIDKEFLLRRRDAPRYVGLRTRLSFTVV